MKKFHLKNRRGTSLVEEICGVAVLMIVVAALLGAICVSSTTVSRNSAQENAAAKAQDIADTLVTKLSTNSGTIADGTQVLDDSYAKLRDAAFPYVAGDEKQYYFKNVTNADGSKGYTIQVRVYFNSGKNHTDIKAYASNTGGAFNT